MTPPTTPDPGKVAARKRHPIKPKSVSDKQVRDWALANGIEGVQMTGRVSLHLRQQFLEAGGVPLPTIFDLQVAPKPTIQSAISPLTESESESNGRPSVYIITSPSGDRFILKDSAVYVEEISIDDTSVDKVIESLGRLTGLPKSDQKTALLQLLSTRLTELASM